MDVENESSLRIDEQVFKKLFDKFYQALCVFASTYLKDDALSADIVQEGFVKFWNKREGFDNYFKVKSFLYTIVRNDCLNYIRFYQGKAIDVVCKIENGKTLAVRTWSEITIRPTTKSGGKIASEKDPRLKYRRGLLVKK